MPTALIEHGFDPTGINPLNLITDEQHNSIDNFSRILAPEHGRFFTESLLIKEGVSNTVLNKDQDYIPIEFEQKLSLRTGKEVCRAILIVNDSLVPPFSLTYQTVGGEHGYANSNLLNVLEDKKLPPLPIEWIDVTDKPFEFAPEQHLHDIREIYGFEYIVASLSRIARAIEIGCFPSYTSLLSYIDSVLNKLKLDMEKYLDDNMPIEFLKFRSIFTIKYFDLDKLENLSAATELDGNNSGKREFTKNDLLINKYMTLEALVGLKNKLFDSFVSMKDSNYGYSVGRYELPLKKSIINLGNSKTVTIIAKQNAIDSNQDYTDSLYPNFIGNKKELTLTKLTNNASDSKQLLIGLEKTNNEMFLGKLNADEGIDDIDWKRFTGPIDFKQISDALLFHIDNHSDPHNVVKSQLHLGALENTEVVSKEEILAMKPIFKYLTFDGLLIFMKNFVLKNGQLDTKPMDVSSNYLTDNCVVVYSPPGYGCDQKCDFPSLPPVTYPPETTLPPTTTPIPTTTLPPTTTQEPTSSSTQPPQNCDPIGTRIWPDVPRVNGNFYDYVSVYADGNCGTYDTVLEENALSAGYSYEKINGHLGRPWHERVSCDIQAIPAMYFYWSNEINSIYPFVNSNLYGNGLSSIKQCINFSGTGDGTITMNVYNRSPSYQTMNIPVKAAFVRLQEQANYYPNRNVDINDAFGFDELFDFHLDTDTSITVPYDRPAKHGNVNGEYNVENGYGAQAGNIVLFTTAVMATNLELYINSPTCEFGLTTTFTHSVPSYDDQIGWQRIKNKIITLYTDPDKVKSLNKSTNVFTDVDEPIPGRTFTVAAGSSGSIELSYFEVLKCKFKVAYEYF